jgi:ketosteroid isomerase-like protein
VAVEEVIDAGGDTVVAVVRFRARGRTSNVPVDVRADLVHTLRDGESWRTRTYFDAAEAFAAAGPPEGAGA